MKMSLVPAGCSEMYPKFKIFGESLISFQIYATHVTTSSQQIPSLPLLLVFLCELIRLCAFKPLVSSSVKCSATCNFLMLSPFHRYFCCFCHTAFASAEFWACKHGSDGGFLSDPEVHRNLRNQIFQSTGRKTGQVYVHMRRKHENASFKAPDHLIIFRYEDLRNLNQHNCKQN